MKAQRKPVRIDVDELRRRLQEAEETLGAIRGGQVDALVVSSPEGEKVFTLRGAEHPYRVLVESISEGAATLSADGTILYCNLALARMVQRPLEHVIGKPLQDLVAAELRPEVRELLAQAASEAIRAETSLIRIDGSSVQVQLSLNPVKIDEQAALGAIVTDLSERIDRRRAEEAVHARDEFITVASHELRTPLSALGLLLGLAENTLARQDCERSCRAIVKARAQIGRIAELIDRLLDVSSIAEGRLKIELKEHDLGEIIQDAADRFVDQAEDANSALQVNAPTGVMAWLDRSRIDQAISNLLSNAVKYGEGKPIEVGLEVRGVTALIEVRDHGMGIDGEDLRRIFDRFERSSPSRHFGGLGLGLYITRQIVLQHGGEVHAESSLGAGARFIVELPLEPVQTEQDRN